MEDEIARAEKELIERKKEMDDIKEEQKAHEKESKQLSAAADVAEADRVAENLQSAYEIASDMHDNSQEEL